MNKDAFQCVLTVSTDAAALAAAAQAVRGVQPAAGQKVTCSTETLDAGMVFVAALASTRLLNPA